MRNDNEITLLGHTIPKEVYEDYKDMERLKNKITDILDKSKELTDDEKIQLKKLLTSMSEKFNEMDSQLAPKRTPPSAGMGY